MTDFQKQMNQVVDGFVAQVTDLARRTALGIVEATFGGDGPKVRSVVPLAAPAVGRPRGTRGAKRSPEDLEELQTRLATFVKGNPGLRIEQINKELGTTTKALALPIRKLLADKVITSQGQKRSTAYFPGKKAGKN